MVIVAVPPFPVVLLLVTTISPCASIAPVFRVNEEPADPPKDSVPLAVRVVPLAILYVAFPVLDFEKVRSAKVVLPVIVWLLVKATVLLSAVKVPLFSQPLVLVRVRPLPSSVRVPPTSMVVEATVLSASRVTVWPSIISIVSVDWGVVLLQLVQVPASLQLPVALDWQA